MSPPSTGVRPAEAAAGAPATAAARWRVRLGLPELAGQGRVVAATVLDAFGVGMFVPLSFLFFVLTTDLTVAQVGLGSAVATALSLPVAPVAGSIVDRWGPRTSLIANNLLVAAGYLCYLLVDSLPALIGSMLLVLCAERLYFAAWPAFVADLAEGAELDRWYAFTTAGTNASVGIGGAAGGLLLGSGWSSAAVSIVVVNAATSLVAAVLLMTPVRVRPAGPRPLTPPPPQPRSAAAREPTGPVDSATPAGTWAGWRTLFRDRVLLILMAAQAAFAFGWLIPTVVLPVYLVEVDRMPAWLPSTALTVNAVTIVLSQSLVTARVVAYPRTRVVSWAAVLMLGSIGLLAVGAAGRGIGTVVVVYAAVLLFTAGQILAGPATTAISATAAPAEARGRYLSVFNLTWALSAIVGPLLVGALIERHAGVFWAILAVLVALGGLGYRLADRWAAADR
ncbi:MFS transporter [Kitasatospora sp. NBC_00240]|uniref:MFS transporter n=1 Tax=Kitasatospora sp. NBC_00240 TaxID=2903567 RepID=UPI00224E163E|nr:MFS transporter [Kitasatospora sp. NBC_00240]MCX5213539.1 MFS transporter [Kitasatospora sp. NBC_00240]